MKNVWYEIQRLNANGWGMCRARIDSLEAAETEVARSQADDPKHRYRIVERTERVVLMTEAGQ